MILEKNKMKQNTKRCFLNRQVQDCSNSILFYLWNDLNCSKKFFVNHAWAPTYLHDKLKFRNILNEKCSPFEVRQKLSIYSTSLKVMKMSRNGKFCFKTRDWVSNSYVRASSNKFLLRFNPSTAYKSYISFEGFTSILYPNRTQLRVKACCTIRSKCLSYWWVVFFCSFPSFL